LSQFFVLENSKKAYHDAALNNTGAVTSQHNLVRLQRFGPRYDANFSAARTAFSEVGSYLNEVVSGCQST